MQGILMPPEPSVSEIGFLLIRHSILVRLHLPHTNTGWTNQQAFSGWGAQALCRLLGLLVFSQKRNVLMWSLTGFPSSKALPREQKKKHQSINDAMIRIPRRSQKTNSLWFVMFFPGHSNSKHSAGCLTPLCKTRIPFTCLATYFTMM